MVVRGIASPLCWSAHNIHHHTKHTQTRRQILKSLKPASTMKEMSYNTLIAVLESWEKLRRIKNFEEEAGVVLYKQ